MTRSWTEFLGLGDEDDQHPLPSARALLKSSLQCTRVNIATFSYLTLVPLAMLAAAVSFARTQTVTKGSSVLFDFGWLLLLATLLLAAVTVPALSYTRLESARRHKVSYGGALKKGLALFYRWWMLELLMVFAVTIGLILILIPGLYFLRRYVLARYVLIDRNTGVKEALQESARMSRPYGSAMWSTVLLLALSPVAFILLPDIFGPLSLLILFVWNMCGTALRYDEIVRIETKRLAPKEKKRPKKSAHRTKKRS